MSVGGRGRRRAPIAGTDPLVAANGADPLDGAGVIGDVIGRAAGSRPGSGDAATWCASGAHVRQRPSASFQQFGQVYCRHCMQKLKVWWNASSCEDVASRSVSLRAAARASSNEVLSSRTKVFSPRERTFTRRSRSFGTADSNV